MYLCLLGANRAEPKRGLAVGSYVMKGILAMKAKRYDYNGNILGE